MTVLFKIWDDGGLDDAQLADVLATLRAECTKPGMADLVVLRKDADGLGDISAAMCTVGQLSVSLVELARRRIVQGPPDFYYAIAVPKSEPVPARAAIRGVWGSIPWPWTGTPTGFLLTEHDRAAPSTTMKAWAFTDFDHARDALDRMVAAGQVPDCHLTYIGLHEPEQVEVP